MSAPYAPTATPNPTPRAHSFGRPLLRLRRPRLLMVGEPGPLRHVIERVAGQIDPDMVIDWTASTAEARRLLRAIAYDAVVTDPGASRDASGLVLRAWCRRLQPETRVGVLSSLSVRDLVTTDPECPALPRPFSAEQLRGFLEQLLSR